MQNIPKPVAEYLDSSDINIFEFKFVSTDDPNESYAQGRHVIGAMRTHYDFSPTAKSKDTFQKFWDIVGEAVRNMNSHGGNYHKHTNTIIIYAAPERFVASFNDEGDFFKRKDIKEKLEKKINPGEKHEAKDTCGMGLEFIMEQTDLIYINTETATLYLGADLEYKTHL